MTLLSDKPENMVNSIDYAVMVWSSYYAALVAKKRLKWLRDKINLLRAIYNMLFNTKVFDKVSVVAPVVVATNAAEQWRESEIYKKLLSVSQVDCDDYATGFKTYAKAYHGFDATFIVARMKSGELHAVNAIATNAPIRQGEETYYMTIILWFDPERHILHVDPLELGIKNIIYVQI